MTTPGTSTDAADLLALDHELSFTLAVAAREVVAVYRPLLEPLGMTHPQYLAMLALWEQSPQRVNQLAERLSIEPATLSPLLRRLEARGLVRRERDPRDERALAVTLTDVGASARAAAAGIPTQVMATLGMDASELEQLQHALVRLTAATRR